MSYVTDSDAANNPRATFDRLLGALRPRLHRYCARMTGSVIDGEDVIQEALVKAFESFEAAGPIAHPEAWLFRIAHNTALDFLRRRARQNAAYLDEEPDMIADPTGATDNRLVAAASLRTFMRLPAAQRSAVILMDVLGLSLREISEVMNTTTLAVKATLHRGRARLRELAEEPDDIPSPVLAEPERSLLPACVDRFNARDFDTLREILADEIRLELVNKTRMQSRDDVGRYFHNYARVGDWRLALGFVDRRPAILVRDPNDASAAPLYFVLLQWRDDRLVHIRDFRYARYVTDGAEIITMSALP